MIDAINLFGELILTFLAVVLPIFGVLLSVFQEAIAKLTEQYARERSNAEDNIKAQAEKMAKETKVDVVNLKRSIATLEKIKHRTEIKLSYLNPRKQILRLFTYLLLAFLGVELALVFRTDQYSVWPSLSLSLICLGYSAGILWKLLSLLVEVKEIIDREKNDSVTKVIELLSSLDQKANKSEFLKVVYITINKKNVTDKGLEVPLKINQKNELHIGINNHEPRMAKNIEVGLVFPPDFVIEKSSSFDFFTTDEKEQIVRYQTDSIQGGTNQLGAALTVTPLKEGECKVRSFIKAENIEVIRREIVFKVV